MSTQAPAQVTNSTESTSPAVVESNPKAEPTFTQADLDRVVKERLAREGIADLRAKAAKLDEITEAQKTAEQKAADALAAERQQAETLRIANLRLAAAADHGVDREHRGLIGGATAEEVEASAKLIGALLRDRAELAAIKAGKPALSTIPVAQLKPGASAVDVVLKPSAASLGVAEAQRRWGKPQANA